MASNDYRYFMYSSEQLRDRTAIEAQIGKKFQPGYVVLKGKRYQYTELSKTGKARYSDSEIVVEGRLSNISYTPIESI